MYEKVEKGSLDVDTKQEPEEGLQWAQHPVIAPPSIGLKNMEHALLWNLPAAWWLGAPHPSNLSLYTPIWREKKKNDTAISRWY